MPSELQDKQNLKRFRLEIHGVVQGVGFRPFVFSAAKKFELNGFVGNESNGVFIEVEGEIENLTNFQNYLRENKPPLAYISSIENREIETQFSREFRIIESKNPTGANTFVSPDVSVCQDCLRELFDKKDRRFHYPFINCTNCGPRFTITKNVPYDRSTTTMSVFQMCELCQKEYDDPLDRRFHAQPNACPNCGPKVWFIKNITEKFEEKEAIAAARKALKDGEIVAIKGIGGFHLACDARNNLAVKLLRQRKGRIDKPFALMCDSLKTAGNFVEIGSIEENFLSAKERPIVLLKKRENDLSKLVAPNNQFFGLMLPYSPLHYLLFDKELNVLVMTSGNFSNEPIVTENKDALEKLSALADSFLLHDREIFVPCDDSVIRVFGVPADGNSFEDNNLSSREYAKIYRKPHELPIRRSRGFAPFPVELPFKVPPVLAVGGELKAAFCLAKEDFAFMSQHIGDMENLETLEAMEKSIGQMRKLFNIEPEIVVGDLHPNYLSTNWAEKNISKIAAEGAKFVKVQHHHAHLASVMAENKLPNEKVIGFAFDGTGYGTDGAIWGGEVLLADYQGFERVAHLKYVPLAGGDISVKKPYRLALAQLWQAGIEWNKNLPCVVVCSATERKILLKQFENNFNVVPTSSFGRLFDAVASIAGVRQAVTYEAQGAIEFEAMLDENVADAYEFKLIEGETIEIDSAHLIFEVVEDVLKQTAISAISAKFNNAVADLILRLALKFREIKKINRVCLSGGCFQNVALLEASVHRLYENKFEIFTHRQVPPNDGGLSLGQAVIASFWNNYLI